MEQDATRLSGLSLNSTSMRWEVRQWCATLTQIDRMSYYPTLLPLNWAPRTSTRCVFKQCNDDGLALAGPGPSIRAAFTLKMIPDD